MYTQNFANDLDFGMNTQHFIRLGKIMLFGYGLANFMGK